MSATSTISAQTVENLFDTIALPSTIFIDRPTHVNLTSSLISLAQATQAHDAPALIVAADDVAEQGFIQAGAQTLAATEIPSAFAQTSTTAYVTTTQKLALAVINAYGPAVQWIRDARVLDANEIDVLIEDLKVSGLKPGRLKEMLKFFYKSLSDGAAEEDFWLITSEEQQVYAILEENLEARRALLPCEVATQALRLWQSLPEAIHTTIAQALPENLVLIADDFGSNSAQSQNLLAALAQGGLVAIKASSEGTNAQEPYPAHEHTQTLKQAADKVLIVDASTPAVQTRTYHYTNPNEEFASIGRQAQEALAQGAHSVLIAVPNNLWAAHIKSALEDQSLTASLDLGSTKVKGDPRDPTRCTALREAALAKLRQNPEDFTALRSWIGLGDWLLRSDAFLELLAYARDHNQSVAEALQILAAQPDEEREAKFFAKFDPALKELQTLLAESSAASESSESSAPPEAVTAPAADPFAPDTPAIDAPSIVIAPYQRCHGRHADVTIIAGAIDGFLPKKDAIDDNETIDHKRLAISRDRALFDDIVATAKQQVIVTSFGEDRLENADALKMAPIRIIMRDEKHYARLKPSRFIQTLTPSA